MKNLSVAKKKKKLSSTLIICYRNHLPYSNPLALVNRLRIQIHKMKFQFSVLVFSLLFLFASSAVSQSNSMVEARMSDFIYRYQSQYFGGALLDFNDAEVIKTNHIKSIKTYYTDCVDLSKKRLKESFLYDSLGRLVEVSGSENSIIDRVTYKYNENGQLAEKKIFSYKEHLEKQLNFTYDSKGKLLKIETMEMLDELPHDHGAHYFPEMAFYSADTILYDFKNLQISIQHREANRYQALTTENAPVQIAFISTFTFDVNGRILQKKFDDDNRNIHLTDQYSACWGFVSNKQYKNLFLDTCQWVKRATLSPDAIADGYTRLDTVFYSENTQDFVKYIYHYTESPVMQFLGSSGDSATQKNVLTFGKNGSLVSRETFTSQDDIIISSYQVNYDQAGRIIQEISFTSASWQRQFGYEPVMSSIPPPPVDRHQRTTYSYYENGILKCIKRTYQEDSHSSCEETFIEYY